MVQRSYLLDAASCSSPSVGSRGEKGNASGDSNLPSNRDSNVHSNGEKPWPLCSIPNASSHEPIIQGAALNEGRYARQNAKIQDRKTHQRARKNLPSDPPRVLADRRGRNPGDGRCSCRCLAGPQWRPFPAQHLEERRKMYKGRWGVGFEDVTEPSKIVKPSEFSTGATGQGTHRNYYDGGKYAYLDTAPDETFIHQPGYFRQLVNGNMIIDASDPSSAKEVSMWWVPGSRKGEEAEYNKWIWSKLVPPKVVADQTPFAVLHAPVYVPKKLEDGGNRGYGAFGCNALIIRDLSDPQHQKEIGRFEPPAQYSGMGIAFHTIYCGILERGFVLTNGETTNSDCNQIYLPNWVIDIRDEEHPVPVAQLPRPAPPPEAPYRAFCFKRGRFGAHNPPHLKPPGKPRQEFIAYSYFIARMRCYHIRPLYNPEEVAYFIPPPGRRLKK